MNKFGNEAASMTERRGLLRLAAAASAGMLGGLLPGCSVSAPQLLAQTKGANPFALGVASGSPQATSVVLWTRLALAAGSTGQIPKAAVAVTWEIAEDERFATGVVRGMAQAVPELGHSVHVQVGGLKPQRYYWYRFRVGEALSAVGRTLTTPSNDVMASRLRLVLASCQHWEQGYFRAWKHAADQQPDVVLFVGDYIYEYGVGSNAGTPARPRRHNGPEVFTLDQYRSRYAHYKSDPDLQLAHRTAPWLVTWDDHEVSNDYGADRDAPLDPSFMKRRAAAYQAFWENMPLPVAMLDPAKPAHLQLYARYNYGRLARIHVLDDRQYRDYQACSGAGRGGSATVWRDQCPELDDPNRSLLGKTQEAWLDQGLKQDTSAWTVIGQQTLMAHTNQATGADFTAGRERYWTDGWNGYQPARERLLASLEAAQGAGRAKDTLVLGGDVHAWYLSDLQRQSAVKQQGAKAPVIASEICGSSITSRSWPQERTDQIVRQIEHYRYGRSDRRGYTLIDMDANKASVQLRAIVDAYDQNTAVETLASFVVPRGKPGIQKA
jgi:alkaline phosphatase D